MNPRQVFLAFLALPLLLLSSCRLGVDTDAHTKVGDKMPDIYVDQTTGSAFWLTAQKGKVVVVNFWATWCGPCQVEMPELEQVWREYRYSPDFVFVAIAREQDEDTVLDFQKNHAKLTFPLAWDPTGAAFAPLASGGIPRTYVVDRHGTIAYQIAGYSPDGIAAIDRAIEKALAEK